MKLVRVGPKNKKESDAIDWRNLDKSFLSNRSQKIDNNFYSAYDSVKKLFENIIPRQRKLMSDAIIQQKVFIKELSLAIEDIDKNPVIPSGRANREILSGMLERAKNDLQHYIFMLNQVPNM